MVESFWMVLFTLLVVAAALQLFPGFRGGAHRWIKAGFYGGALVAVIGWTLLKSFFVLGGRRLAGR